MPFCQRRGRIYLLLNGDLARLNVGQLFLMATGRALRSWNVLAVYTWTYRIRLKEISHQIVTAGSASAPLRTGGGKLRPWPLAQILRPSVQREGSESAMAERITHFSYDALVCLDTSSVHRSIEDLIRSKLTIKLFNLDQSIEFFLLIWLTNAECHCCG